MSWWRLFPPPPKRSYGSDSTEEHLREDKLTGGWPRRSPWPSPSVSRAMSSDEPGRSARAGDRFGDHEYHGVGLVEAGVGVAREVLAVVVDAEGAVVLVPEGGVVAEGTGVRVDVGHVAAVVAVV